MVLVQPIPNDVVDSFANKSVVSTAKCQRLFWTVLSVDVFVKSVQAVPVGVVDSIVSRCSSGIRTGSTSGCRGQY